MTNNRGFTLVEFLVAMVILMVGLLGMLQGINLAMEKNVGNLFRDEALRVADDLMMKKRTLAFVSVSATTASPNYKSYPEVPQARRYARGIYKNYSVQQIVNQTTANTKEIIINVSWLYKNRKNTHSVSSFISTMSQ